MGGLQRQSGLSIKQQIVNLLYSRGPMTIRDMRINLKRKSRKYPIIREQYSRTARQQAFDAFDYGRRPAKVAPMAGISLRTACRYFADWKKLPKNLELRCCVAKALLRNKDELSDQTAKMITDYLGTPEEEVIMRLEKPWGPRLGRRELREAFKEVGIASEDE